MHGADQAADADLMADPSHGLGPLRLQRGEGLAIGHTDGGAARRIGGAVSRGGVHHLTGASVGIVADGPGPRRSRLHPFRHPVRIMKHARHQPIQRRRLGRPQPHAQGAVEMLQGQGRTQFRVGGRQQPAITVFQRDIARGGRLVRQVLDRPDRRRRRDRLGQPRDRALGQKSLARRRHNRFRSAGATDDQQDRRRRAQGGDRPHCPALQPSWTEVAPASVGAATTWSDGPFAWSPAAP